ncbi:hypothetical protein AJ80_04006 [Polytolypa hystricis UAMH7299]|uniref:L-ornithine N(5)-monooxygenase n=1 Tax=Polytolypa hystricis (strain UAMH7299) TaxID=1447883 RepID=A0A2B7YCW7_POLH7|nr:hypothetical protein AJ80_04006 [Polytolypa hystricis UAMH7299]
MESVLKTTTVQGGSNPLPEDSKSKGLGSSSKYDIVCAGFGAAALSIAIAMRERGYKGRVLFLERQAEFGWHTGMLLPGTKMQISYLKDLATMRDPRSHFTFLNYLHTKGRLVHFTNLSTHTPFREEFNDYMKWCASHFNDLVQYNQEVVSISAVESRAGWAAESFKVVARDVKSGELRELVTKHVIVANGGEAAIPHGFMQHYGRNTVIHSSTYLKVVPQQFKQPTSRYRFAVVGGGQSAVEISEDIASRYPNAQVDIITKSSALHPSDDSPFVNEIFDPSSVDSFYALNRSAREKQLCDNKATNYGVVRLPLIESIYEKLYRQKLLDPNPSNWPLRVIAEREVRGLQEVGKNQVTLELKHSRTGETEVTSEKYDLVILATGYKRNPFLNVLKPLQSVLETQSSGEQFGVDRNYRLRFAEGKVGRDAGVWLQGCCESSHGLSDSLLSILATRSAELLDSISSSSKFAQDYARL